jgi:protein-S-isoprenylcysteine O-methyltransferase Ste14
MWSGPVTTATGSIPRRDPELSEGMAMTSRSVGMTALHGLHSALHALPMGGDRPIFRRRDRLSRVGSITTNIVVASFYVVFLYSSVKFWLSTGSLVGIGLVVFNTFLVVFLLTRRRPAIVTKSIWNWIFAPTAAVLPLLLRPVASAGSLAIAITSVGQVLGLAIMVASLVTLNRSMGIVAANRGVKTGGPYAWVRHPLYAGEIVFLVSVVVSHWNYLNGSIVVAVILLQVIRSIHEEAVLLSDEQYVRYRAVVPCRLVPRLF